MKRYLTTTALSCVLVLSSLLAAAAQQPKTTRDSAAEIKSLQEKRIEVLQKLVKVCDSQQRVGALPFESVAAAQYELIDAQLDATNKPKERVVLLEQELKVAEHVQRYLEGKYKAGFKSFEADLLRAESQCLSVKIELLRERSRLKAVTK